MRTLLTHETLAPPSSLHPGLSARFLHLPSPAVHLLSPLGPGQLDRQVPVFRAAMKRVIIELSDTDARLLTARARKVGLDLRDFVKAVALDIVAPPRVTLRDVARVAGVSPMAVSFVLNNAPGEISEATTDRIKAAAKKLGWRPSMLARTLRKKRN